MATLQDKRMVEIIKNNSKKIITVIRNNLRVLEECSLNIKKARQDPKSAALLQQEFANSRNLINSIEFNIKELEKCRQQLMDLQTRPSLEMDKIVTEVQRAISKFTATNQEINSNSFLFDSVSYNTHPVSSSSASNQSKLFSKEFVEDNTKLKDSKHRLEEVEAINRDLVELHEIATNMATMVNEQGLVVDHIESNITEAEQNVNEGAKSLIKASGYAGALGPITCAAIGGSVLGPIGAVVGFKIGLASAVGGSVLSYCGAKYVRNKNLEESQSDVNSIDQKS